MLYLAKVIRVSYDIFEHRLHVCYTVTGDYSASYSQYDNNAEIIGLFCTLCSPRTHIHQKRYNTDMFDPEKMQQCYY